MSGGFGHSILLGTMRIDTAALAPGDYEFTVDSNLDSGISVITHFGDPELLFGQGVIHVVPEPGMLAILALGSVTLATHRINLRLR